MKNVENPMYNTCFTQDRNGFPGWTGVRFTSGNGSFRTIDLDSPFYDNPGMAETRSLTPLWQGLPSDPKAAATALLDAWLNGRKATTLRTYQQAIENFAAFLQLPTREAAVALFLGIKDGGRANKLVLDYRNWMTEQKVAGTQKALSSATISVRMAALKSLAQLGRTLGKISWGVEIKAPKVEQYVDTRGPGFDRIRDEVKALDGKDDLVSLRNRLLLAMLGTMGLRRGEAAALDIEDVDLQEKRLFYLGKGRSEEEPMTIPDEIAIMLSRWLAARQAAAGPLFINFSRGDKKEKRLSGRSIGRICHAHGLGHAHGLRHSAVTRALEKSDGNITKVAKFSRHKNVQTLLRYDDNRKDEGGEVSRGLAGEL